MKRLLAGLCLLAVGCGGVSTESTTENFKTLNIIPKPVEAKKLSGSFVISNGTKILVDSGCEDGVKAANFFAELMKKRTGISMTVAEENPMSALAVGAILFTKSKESDKLPADGYNLDVSKKSIVIRAKGYGGFFYGIQSMMQLMPTSVYKIKGKKVGLVNVDCAQIRDYPRFVWRAMMLDCSRQFFDVAYVKKFIDNLAVHKINVFHWHLTDDNGWRIEIKSWPDLTKKGAWRGKGCVLPASAGSSPEEVYGGFYTQSQIKDIVQYALARNINILPEIDVPGHCKGVIASYPTCGCDSKLDSKSVQGVTKNVWCAGREENFKMLDDIIRETASLFPFSYIHIGGDEVNQKYWAGCTRCRALIKKKGYKRTSQVQNYFIRRMEKIVRGYGKKMIGWNEIMHGGELAKDTAIMSWISTAPGYRAAKKGHPVVMSPGPYTYFDMAQYPGERGHWWAGVVSTEKCYSFDPMKGNDLKPGQMKNIFGVEACLWGEYLDKPKGQADFQTYPRLCALSELTWTPQKLRSWEDFKGRLGRVHLARLENLGIHYRVPHPTATVRKGMVTVKPPYPHANVRFTTNGKIPTAESSKWDGKPFFCSNSSLLRMATFRKSGRTSSVIKGAKPEVLANWSEKTLSMTFKNWDVDVTDFIDENGNWTLNVSRTWGKHGIEIKSLALWQDGKEIVKDATGIVLAYKKRNHKLYRLPVTQHKAGSKYIVRMVAKYLGGSKSRGMLVLDKSPWIEPKIEKVETNMKAYGKNDTAKLTDWDRSSYFQLGRSPKRGDVLTVTFNAPVDAKYLEVITGKPNQSKDILVEGELAVSADGKTFTKVSNFEYGTAKTNLSQKVKAVRINCIAGQGNEWLVIQDIRLK